MTPLDAARVNRTFYKKCLNGPTPVSAVESQIKISMLVLHTAAAAQLELENNTSTWYNSRACYNNSWYESNRCWLMHMAHSSVNTVHIYPYHIIIESTQKKYELPYVPGIYGRLEVAVSVGTGGASIMYGVLLLVFVGFGCRIHIVSRVFVVLTFPFLP